jgi:hypothetical protein
LSARPHLRVLEQEPMINADTGEILQSACPKCHEAITKTAQAVRDYENLDVETRRLRAQVRALKRDRDKERQVSAHRAAVERIWASYQDTVGKHRSKLDGARFDAIERMLKLGYEMEHFELAFLGAAHDAFEKGGRRFDSLNLICRDADKFEDFCNRGAIWKRGNRAAG